MDSGAEKRIGEFLRHLRQSRGWTLEHTAQSAGVTRVTLNRWETGRHEPRLTELEAVLAALNATPGQQRQAIARMEAPRARVQVQREIARVGEHTGIGPMPGGGDLLRTLRLRRGLSLDEAAHALGITTRTLRLWEQGEIVPPPTRRDALLTLLHACPEERRALADGAVFLHPPLREAAADPQALRAVCQPWFWPDFHRTYYRGPYPATELTYLTLAAQAWPMAQRSAAGRELLAEIYTNYADYLVYARRDVEAGRYAERALDIMPYSPSPQPFMMHAALVSSQASAYRGGKRGVRQALEIVHLWRPVTRHPTFEAWLVACQAEFLALAGAAEAALTASRESARLAEAWENGRDLPYRTRDRAEILLDAGRTAEALAILAALRSGDPVFDAGIQLKRVAAWLTLNERQEAHQELLTANVFVAAHHLAHLQREVEILARRL